MCLHWIFYFFVIIPLIRAEYMVLPSQRYAVDGFDFSLACQLSNGTATPNVLVWTRNNFNVAYFHSRNQQITQVSKTYKYQIRNESTYVVTIDGSDVITENGSVWRCQGAAGEGHSEDYILIFHALASPVIQSYNLKENLTESVNLTLTCILPGGDIETNEIAWYCKGNVVLGVKTCNMNGMNITISFNVDRTYNGQKCVCEAYDVDVVDNKKTAEVSLNIHYPPEVNVSVHGDPDNNVVKLTCLAHGNPDVYTFKGWKQMYNGTVVRSNADFEFMSNDLTTLTLYNTSCKDNGDYVCSVENGVKTQRNMTIVESLTSLYFDDPSNVTIDVQSIPENYSVILRCNQPCDPNAVVFNGWKQLHNGTVIRSNDDFLHMSNDNQTLTLFNVSLVDSGEYVCSVYNGFKERGIPFFNEGLKYLNFKAKSVFNSRTQFVSKVGETVVIKVPFYSNPVVSSIDNITWKNVQTNNTSFPDWNFQMFLYDEKIEIQMYKKKVLWPGTTAVMKINRIQACDFGQYAVTVENDFDLSATFCFSILQSGPPLRPENFRLVSINTTCATFSWGSTHNGYEREKFVIIYQTSNEDVTSIEINDTKGQPNNYTYSVENLESSTSYHFWLYASNSDGNSSFCGPLLIVTRKEKSSFNKDKVILLSTISVSGLCLILIPVVYMVYKKCKGPTYVRLKDKRFECVLYDKVNERVSRIMDASIRYSNAVDYSEISDVARFVPQSQRYSHYSDYHFCLSAESLEDLQRYENTKIN